MGGNAFKATLPDASFPRMRPALYNELKQRVAASLQTVYTSVAVPHEAPGKLDFGDIDFVVCHPRDGLNPEMLRVALGAQHIIAIGNVSNLAIPLRDKDSFCQVDIHVCDDIDDWQRTFFFLSYGDLSMILGLMARALDLSLGRHGLKLARPLPTSPQLAFMLSSSVPNILDFFGLSMDRWQQGFSSEADIFSWLSTSRLYNPAKLLRCEATNTSGSRTRDARPMYQRFLVYAQRHEAPCPQLPSALEAINVFGKRSLHDALLHVAAAKKHVQSVFTGKLVQAWTGVSGMPVRFVMDETKRRLGGEGIMHTVAGISIDTLQPEGIPAMHLTLRVWESAMAEMSADQVKTLVMEVKLELEAEGKLDFDWRAAKQKRASQRSSDTQGLA